MVPGFGALPALLWGSPLLVTARRWLGEQEETCTTAAAIG